MDKVLRNFHKKVKSLVTKSFPLFRKKDKPSWAPNVVEEFITTYDPKKKLFLLWDIPEKFQDFYKLFFEDFQVFFIKTEEELICLDKSLSISSEDVTLVTLHNKNFKQAISFCKDYNLRCLTLTPGLIGHPVYHNLSACFIELAGEMLINHIRSVELTPALLEQATRLQSLYCSLNIGKSGTPSFIDVDKFLGPKLKKRVLVLAHQDTENPKISENFLLALARKENPDADIFVYRKTESPSFKLIQEEITLNDQTYHYAVISKLIRSTDAIRVCDHVITDHAMEAVDAIFYHKPLTVTGNPFYAGWGLTDDRSAARQQRQLSNSEFFAIIFLKCTRYCYDNHDPVSGFLSTIFDVTGSYALQKAKSAMEPYTAEKIARLCESDYWPAILNTEAKSLLTAKDITTIYPAGKKTSAALAATFIGTSNEPVSPDLFTSKLQEAGSLISNYQYDAAEKALFHLLQCGFIRRDVFSMLAEIYAATFYFHDAINLQGIALKMTNPKTENYSVKHNESLYILGDADQLLKSLCLAIKSVPSQFIQAYSYKSLLQQIFGADFQYASHFFNASKGRLKNGKRTENSLLNIAKGFMLLQEPEKQLEILASIKNPKNLLKYNLSKVTAYIQTGDYFKAREIIEELIQKYSEFDVYREAVRLALLMNDSAWGQQLLQREKQLHQHSVGTLIEPSLLKRLLLISGRIPEGFAQFRNVEICNILKKCLPGGYIQKSSEAIGNNVLVVMISGIGDEIRLATIYPKIAALFSGKKVTFTCEPRLLELFTRSYPTLNFLPVLRQRFITYKTTLNNYNDLPNLQLHKIFDNAGWSFAKDADNVTLITDILADVLKDKSCFAKNSYLKAAPERVAFWLNRTKSPRIKIGLCWRSNLLSHTRSTGYLSIEHFKPLLDKFANHNVDFYNMQYDDASEEINWVAKHCQNKIIHFDDLDQYNDINSVAAFMCCMDLVIAPPTAVIELAGALGRPAYLLSNIGEVSWRKTDEQLKKDVWSPSIVHIEGNSYGDKVSLVEHLIQKIETFVANVHAKELEEST